MLLPDAVMRPAEVGETVVYHEEQTEVGASAWFEGHDGNGVLIPYHSSITNTADDFTYELCEAGEKHDGFLKLFLGELTDGDSFVIKSLPG